MEGQERSGCVQVALRNGEYLSPGATHQRLWRARSRVSDGALLEALA